MTTKEKLESELENERNLLDSLAMKGKDRTKMYREHLKKFKAIKKEFETMEGKK